MNIHLGTLKILSAKEHLELMAKPVSEALFGLPGADRAGVVEIDSAFSDTPTFCAHFAVGIEKAANCVILEAKRGDRSWFVACVILGSTRADVNGLVRKTLDARKVSFAPMERAVSETGMEYGGISPVGLPSDWPVLIDSAVVDFDYVIIGSGIRKSKIIVPGALLASLPNAQVLQGLGRPSA